MEPLRSHDAEPIRLADEAAAVRLRAALARRIQDVIGLPTSRITLHERSMAADLLLDMLRDCDEGLRRRAAERIVPITDAPKNLLRRLSSDAIDVARPLLEESEAFDDSDLIFVAQTGTTAHRVLISRRRHVSQAVSDALVMQDEPDVALALLRNEGAGLSPIALDRLVELSRDHGELMGPMLRRPELTPSQALTAFWWANRADRRRILQRYSAERLTMQESVSDLFAEAARLGWSDGTVRKTLQFIERRQRNRAALERSDYASLEDAVAHLEARPSRELIREIGYLAGIKPGTAAQIFADPGGEAIAVLVKATGMKRQHLQSIFNALRRTAAGDDSLEAAIMIFDTLSTNRAQTVLRYWNWALTSAMAPRDVIAMDEDTAAMLGDASAAARMATLVFRG
jgi:uncharacterized protein (DUF2336 family)